jgi:hypothetical protein
MEENSTHISTKGDIVITTQARQLLALGFTLSDLDQIQDYGVSLVNVAKEMQIFKDGISKTILDRPASIGDGIIKLSESDFKEAAAFFDKEKNTLKLKKFVPASGAASRMFKFLSAFLNDFDINKETINGYINRNKAAALTTFLAGKDKLPFYKMLNEHLKANYANGEWRESDRRNYQLIKLLLDPEELDFCNKPKGILPFHKYAGHIATPIEEHLNEGARYASSQGVSYLHFTVSETHRAEFEKIIAEVKEKVETESGVTIHINFSYQDKATDTIAVGMDNKPFRDADGKLVFRPAGHGALINNLNAIDADIVFIKNIDNVIQNHIEVITLYKKALAGMLIELQQKIFTYLEHLENAAVDPGDIDQMISFMCTRLNADKTIFEGLSPREKISLIKDKLNRPIRVCGMVRNEGEPGGGPFWVRDNKGDISLQIVESSQVDLQNREQARILENSLYFNPVDLVCATKDYKGNRFDLHNYVDADSGFIVMKNKDGRELKAYELPGLWNGAMAKWNTVFVEVPLVTFNPVKTVNDLLKPAHQPQ